MLRYQRLRLLFDTTPNCFSLDIKSVSVTASYNGALKAQGDNTLAVNLLCSHTTPVIWVFVSKIHIKFVKKTSWL